MHPCEVQCVLSSPSLTCAAWSWLDDATTRTPLAFVRDLANPASGSHADVTINDAHMTDRNVTKVVDCDILFKIETGQNRKRKILPNGRDLRCFLCLDLDVAEFLFKHRFCVCLIFRCQDLFETSTQRSNHTEKRFDRVCKIYIVKRSLLISKSGSYFLLSIQFRVDFWQLSSNRTRLMS